MRRDYLAPPAFVLSALFALISIIDILSQGWPMRLGMPQWRFTTVGLLASALPVIMLGGLIALATAALLDRPRALRVISTLAALVFVLLVVGLFMFRMDAVQARETITRPQILGAFDLSITVASFKLACGALVALLLAVAGFRGARGALVAPGRSDGTSAGFVAGYGDSSAASRTGLPAAAVAGNEVMDSTADPAHPVSKAGSAPLV